MNEESSIDDIEEGFIKINNKLCYKYMPLGGVSWIKEKIKNNEEIEIKDLEIIKKMYSNIIDVITYDDLIHRVENVISGMKKNNR